MINIENKYVFRFFLNKGSVPTFLTWLGRQFHNFGAQTENALSSYVFVLDVDVARSPKELEHITRDCFVFFHSCHCSETYPGHSP